MSHEKRHAKPTPLLGKQQAKAWLMVVTLCVMGWLMGSLTGCASPPFERQTLVPLGVTSPQQVLGNLGRGMPTRLVTDDTVVIKAPFRDELAVLSVVKIDRLAVSLELMGMSHTGVKLFHVAYEDGKPVIRYAAPPLVEQKQVLESLATDSWHIYFDLLPELEAWQKTSWDDMTFKRKTEQGNLTYTVARIAENKDAPPRTVLIEKKLSTWTGTKWRVRYYHYQQQTKADSQGDADASISENAISEASDARDASHLKLHPAGIVLENKKYHYRIVVKNRKWRELSQ